MKWLIIAFGALLLGSGLIVFWAPIPIGAVMIFSGSTLLIGHSRWFARLILNLRRRYGLLDRFLVKAGTRLPAKLQEVFARSEPKDR